jgi:hypothetical protein
MKKAGFAALGLALVAASTADAQLSMQMGNGWNFSFAGNVNVFYIYASGNTNSDVEGGLLGDRRESAIGSGLLPAFATFSANGKEGNTDLGVTFGFAPQVSFGTGTASFFGTDAAGARIDMRQVFLTVGGDWGQILAGKQLGLYQRQNLVQDMTIFGLGTNIGTRGTSLGRIGYGYEYTDFRGQISYSTKAGKPAQFSIGIFEPTDLGDSYTVRQTPRVEAELTYNKKFSNGSFGFHASGMFQNAKDDIGTGSTSKTATGVAGGLSVDVSGFKLAGSAFTSKGLGGIFQGGISLVSGAASDTELANGDLRTSYGYYGQATYTPKGSKVTFGTSYGASRLKLGASESAVGNELVAKRESVVGLISYQVTKSYRVLGEYVWSKDSNQAGDDGNTQNQIGLGMMLFY